MSTIQKTETYNDYKMQALKDLHIWKHLSPEEKNRVKTESNEISLDQFARSLIDKYYEVMLADEVEPKLKRDGKRGLIDDLDLSLRTTNALKRNRIFMVEDFIHFVNKNGWNKLATFGHNCAKEVLAKINPGISDKKLDQLVAKTRVVYKKEKG
jgi:DNA-directed RNA polymerase alpha subunit